MSLDGLISIWSLIISILSIILAIISINMQVRDKPKLIVKDIRVAFSGSKSSTDIQWRNYVSSIEVIIENKGSRIALDCEALVLFAYMDALPLFPQTPQSTIDMEQKLFSIGPKQKKRLIGAWKIKNGIIEGNDNKLSTEQFLQVAVPLTVKVKSGNREITKELKIEDAREQYEKFQKNQYSSQL